MLRNYTFLFLVLLSVVGLKAQYQINGDAVDLGNNTYELTPNAEWKSGSVFFQVRHHLDSFFRVEGAFNFGALEFGADGMVFVMQEQCLQVGSAGGGMGYENIAGQSIGLEFDTYQNVGSPSNDPVYDHLALHQMGSIDHLINLAGPFQIHATKANVEDGLWYDFLIEYDPVNQLIEVYVAGSLRLSHNINLKQDIFNGNPYVYWGFTSATGGHYAANLVRIDDNTSLNFLDDTICSGTTSLTLPPLAGTNVAFAKASNSSSNQQGGAGPPYSNYAFDGNLQSRWSSAYADSQWVSVDLGVPMRIDSVLLIWESAYGSEYKIQYSDDLINWIDLYHETAGIGGSEWINFSPVTTQHVRMLGLQRATPYGFSLYEMEVWGGQQYAWTPNDGSISDTTSNAPIFSPSSTTTYSVEIPDACLGSVSFDYTVYVLGNNTLLSTLADTVCSNSVVDLTDAAILQNTNGSNLTFWLDSNATIPVLQADSITSSGSYYVVADNGFCQSILGLDIVFADVDTLSQSLAVVSDYNGQSISCYGAQDGSIRSTVLSPTTLSYLWSDGQSTSLASGLASGWYFVTVTDSYDCFDIDSIFLTQPSVLSIDTALIQATLCYADSNGQITVNAAGGQASYQYLWSNATTTNSASNIASGMHYLSITDANNCLYFDSFFVSQPAPVSIVSVIQPLNCDSSQNAAAAVSVTGGLPDYTYQWDNGATTATIEALSAGNYYLTVSDLNNCFSFDTVFINEPLVPTLFPSIAFDTIFAGTSVATSTGNDQSQVGVVYSWFYQGPDTAFFEPSNQANSMFYPSSSGTYNLQINALSLDSCVAFGQLVLEVIDFATPTVPDAFSPNDDGINDVFQAIDLDPQYLISLKIFNRWSNLIYEDDGLGYWDGNYQGILQAADVYIYVLVWQFPGQKVKVRKGSLTLMR